MSNTESKGYLIEIEGCVCHSFAYLDLNAFVLN